MKRLLSFIVAMSMITCLFGQVYYQPINDNSERMRAWFKSTLHVPRGTTPGLNNGKTEAGALYFNTTDGYLYVWNGSVWSKYAKYSDVSASANMANTDLTLTGNRTHDGDGHEMVFNNFDNIQLIATDLLLNADAGNVTLNLFNGGAMALAADNNIAFTTPQLQFDHPSLSGSSPGWVWTLDDAFGNGSWQPASGGGSGGGSGLQKTKYFLFSGQSQAWAATGPSSLDTASDPRVKVFCHSCATPSIITAHINQRPFRTAGYNSLDGGNTRSDLNGSVSPAFYFAKRWAQTYNDTVVIILAPADGRSITYWFNGATKAQYMDSITTRAIAAGVPRIDGFFWQHGEADYGMSETQYMTAVDSIQSYLYNRYSWYPKTTPFVVGGLPKPGVQTIAADTAYVQKDSTLRKFDWDNNVYTGYAPSDTTMKLWAGGEDIHYGDAAIRELGYNRYWAAYHSLPAQHATVNVKPERPTRFVETTFKVGTTTNAPPNGATEYTNTAMLWRKIQVWKNGNRLNEIDDIVVNNSAAKVTFLSALATNDVVQIVAEDTTYWSTVTPQAAADRFVDINFDYPAVQNTFPKSIYQSAAGVWEDNIPVSGYGHGAASKYTLAAGQDGRVIMKYTGAECQNVNFGFQTSYANPGGSSIFAGINIYGTSVYGVESGGYNSSGYTVSVNDYLCIYRSGSTLKIQSSTDKITWTDRYTYTVTSSAKLYSAAEFNTGGVLKFPQIQ